MAPLSETGRPQSVAGPPTRPRPEGAARTRYRGLFEMPTGQVKWFNETKGYGFLSRDDGGEVFVHTKALPAGVTTLRPGQRVEFGIAAGHRGDQAMTVTLLDALPSVAVNQRKSADDM